MQDKTTSLGTDPLSIRISGSGEYVKSQVEHLADYFDYIEADRKEEIRQDVEFDGNHYQLDTII